VNAQKFRLTAQRHRVMPSSSSSCSYPLGLIVLHACVRTFVGVCVCVCDLTHVRGYTYTQSLEPSPGCPGIWQIPAPHSYECGLIRSLSYSMLAPHPHDLWCALVKDLRIHRFAVRMSPAHPFGCTEHVLTKTRKGRSVNQDIRCADFLSKTRKLRDTTQDRTFDESIVIER
jgi:hypothetical protein